MAMQQTLYEYLFKGRVYRQIHLLKKQTVQVVRGNTY